MKKWLIMIVVVVVLGLVVIPAVANGGFRMGFGQRGVVNNNNVPLSEEEHATWLEEQVKEGWMTQQQADYMKQMHNWRINGVNEQEYFTWVDQQVKDGWMTTKQADWLKENYQLYKEKYGENVPLRGMGMGRAHMGANGVGCGRGMGRGMGL